MTLMETFEFLSYVVTVVGLPLAIIVFIIEQRKERDNDEEEIYQRLSDEYREFLKLVLDNADLQLLRRQGIRQELTEEQKERRLAIFGILISLFERAYLLVYEDDMDKKARRLWRSWEDYMIEWVRRVEFRDALPNLLEGEDEEFTQYIRRPFYDRCGVMAPRLHRRVTDIAPHSKPPENYHSIFSFGSVSGNSSSLPAAETTS
jgi:hypothetical protein